MQQGNGVSFTPSSPKECYTPGIMFVWLKKGEMYINYKLINYINYKLLIEDLQ